MKKVLSIIMIFCMIMTVTVCGVSFASATETETPIWDGSIAESFASGTGTSSDPYIIETAAQFAYFSNAVTSDGISFSGKYIKLANDIFLNDTSDWKNWATVAPVNTWTPVGSKSKPFKGCFMGNNKTVSGIYVNDVTYAGLFGYSYKATINDICVKQSYIKSDVSGYAGGIIGYFDGVNDCLNGCINYATVSGYYAGGVCGYSKGCSLLNCSNIGNVIGMYSGGIVGYYNGAKDCSVSCCYNGGSIDGETSGGIAGGFFTSIITNYVCNAMGYCSSPLADFYCTIKDCYNYGEVNSKEYSGGIVGECSLSNTYFSSVSCSERCVQFSYNVGIIKSDGQSGQIIGNPANDEKDPFLNKSYYYNPIPSAQYALGGASSDSKYATALSDEKAKQQGSYSYLNFETIWTMSGDENYPYPELSSNPHLTNHEHSYDSTVTTPATHTSTGVMTFTCVCGESYTEIIDKNATHNYVAVVTEPTCTEKGYTTYNCECGDSYVADYVDATGHSHTSEITNPATHTTTGVITFTCHCGDTYTEVIEKIEKHDFDSVVTEPTCTEQGYTTYTCECGESYTRDFVSATGHSHTSEITNPATHTTTGVITFTCHCGDTYTEVIEKIEKHDFDSVVTEPTCTEQGYTTYTCECGESYTRDFVSATGHSHTSEITNPATHTSTGVKTYICGCGDTYTEVIEKTTTHNHISVVTEPTCTEKGYTTYTCECGDTYIDNYVDATGHSEGDNNGNCSTCGEHICDHDCHKSGIAGFFWKIVCFFSKLFGSNKFCECGKAHY